MKNFGPAIALLLAGLLVTVIAYRQFRADGEAGGSTVALQTDSRTQLASPTPPAAQVGDTDSGSHAARADAGGSPEAEAQEQGVDPASDTETAPAGDAASSSPMADAQTPPGSSQPPPAAGDDGAAILRRAAQAYDGVRSLRAQFTQELYNPILRRTFTSRGTLYQQSPDKLLLQFSDPEGDIVVSDGTYVWVYYPSADARQVMRSAVASGPGAVDLRGQFAGDPTERFEFTYHGSEQVAGRPAHAMTLVPRQRGAGYRSLKVWLDAADHLARQFEITEDNGTIRRFELSGLELNPSLPDTLFRFTPPPDARIVDAG